MLAIGVQWDESRFRLAGAREHDFLALSRSLEQLG
jgi:hypothetical protein